MEVENTSSVEDVRLIKEVESIKLIRNSRGYGWEIKIIGVDVNRLESINIDMETRFGKGNGNGQE